MTRGGPPSHRLSISTRFGCMTCPPHECMSIVPAPVCTPRSVKAACSSVAPARTRGRTCLRSKWCRPSWTRWGCRWPRMWSRVSEPMTRCIGPALRGCRRVEAGTGYSTWVTARWRRVTRERGSPPPVMFTCAPCRRCSWKKRFETVSAFRQAVVAIVQRYSVEVLVWFRLNPYDTPRPVRAYRGQPARVDHDRHAAVEVRVDAAALEATIHRLGWRVYGTNQPGASLSLAHAVLAYRSAYQVERRLGRLTGRFVDFWVFFTPYNTGFSSFFSKPP